MMIDFEFDPVGLLRSLYVLRQKATIEQVYHARVVAVDDGIVDYLAFNGADAPLPQPGPKPRR